MNELQALTLGLALMFSLFSVRNWIVSAVAKRSVSGLSEGCAAASWAFLYYMKLNGGTF
jgi:hypothetical protein